MDNDQMPGGDVKDVELARRLEAYAEARLSPTSSATSRMRAHVMAAAQRQAALGLADTARVAMAAVDVARPTRMRGSAWRRPMAGLLAACLTLTLAVGSVAAAHAGGPLYGARIWVETLTLPASLSNRATAEVQRLQERLAEAAAAEAAGDTEAADAALAAYNTIVNEATAGTDNDAAANATIDAGVRRNIEVLTILAGRVPWQARDAIEHAIERSSSAVDGLRDKPGVDGKPGNPPGAGPTSGPLHTANPHKPTPAPAVVTPRPNSGSTPKPHPTPKAGGKPSSPPGGPEAN